MLTYELKKGAGVPLYEALYRCIRADILSGALRPGQKLPSKRALAAHLEVSKITVETAYSQLLAEGFIFSREKVGYFVEYVERTHPAQPVLPVGAPAPKEPYIDLTGAAPARFPFSVWSRLQREVMADLEEKLLLRPPSLGCMELRQAIAAHLADFRGMHVSPENILVGAGTDFLYNVIIQLLGRDLVYALEEPGYDKTRKLYTAAGASCISAGMDEKGVIPETLENAGVLHISPSHHFPTGLVTPMTRRQELLNWAGEEKWIIEDDYDSEFRFDAHPMATLQSMDRRGRVIYMNTFSKTLAPSIRIGYLVLPDALLKKFREALSFYSCTVPSFEQHTLALFLSRGYYEKHINRMRKFYRARRNQVISLLQSCPWADRMTILEQDAGLHFLLKVESSLSGEALAGLLDAAHIRVRPLSHYYHGSAPAADSCLVINYAGLDEPGMKSLREKLLASEEAGKPRFCE